MKNRVDMTTITVLPNDEIKYVKSITFNVELYGRSYTGKVVYKRDPSDVYKIDGSKRSPIDEMMCYYPEECYPSDSIDDIILEGVRKKYHSALVHTHLMLFDCDKDRIVAELASYTSVSFQINILPRIDDIEASVVNGKTSWRVFTKELPLYLTNSNDITLFQNEGSFIYYDLDKEQEMIDIEPQLLSRVTVF